MSKVNRLMIVILLFSMLLAACAPAATPAPTAVAVPTTAPTAVPTAVPTATTVPTATATPEPAPDFTALFSQLIVSIPADKGYGTVSASALNAELADKAPFLLDVREASELEKSGYIKGAVNMPVRTLLNNLDKLPAQDQAIVIYCASGHRGGFAMAALKFLGYSNVRNLAGGMNGWIAAKLATETGKPADPKAGTAPKLASQSLFKALNNFFTQMPDSFYSTSAANLNTALADAAKTPVMVDVRTTDEFAKNGYIEGALNFPMDKVFSSLDKLPAKDKAIVVYCVSGHRGAIVAMGLRLAGWTNVTNLGGGLNAWKAGQFPVAGWVDWTAVWTDFFKNMPAGYYSISAADLNAALADAAKAPFVVDVRETAEIEKDGYIQGSVNIPTRDVLKNLDKLPAQDKAIVVTCASGHRGAMVMAALRFLGYKDVRNLAGGTGAWKKASLALVTGSKPEAPKAGTAPKVDKTRLEQLMGFFTAIPDGFYATSPANLNTALADAAKKPVIIDVRTAEELKSDGFIKDSINISLVDLFSSLDKLPKDKAAAVVVLCKSGHRGALAMMALRQIGYTNVINLGGGLSAWVAAQLPVEK
jgi:rhodanese-related sulfurtransferase